MLVVDDDPALVDTVRELLVDEGFEVDAFTDAPSALERLRSGERAPDVLLVDYVMPRMSGDELIREATRAGVRAPIVLFTAMAEPNVDRHRVAVLHKPFDIEELLGVLARVLAEQERASTS